MYCPGEEEWASLSPSMRTAGVYGDPASIRDTEGPPNTSVGITPQLRQAEPQHGGLTEPWKMVTRELQESMLNTRVVSKKNDNIKDPLDVPDEVDLRTHSSATPYIRGGDFVKGARTLTMRDGENPSAGRQYDRAMQSNPPEQQVKPASDSIDSGLMTSPVEYSSAIIINPSLAGRTKDGEPKVSGSDTGCYPTKCSPPSDNDHHEGETNSMNSNVRPFKHPTTTTTGAQRAVKGPVSSSYSERSRSMETNGRPSNNQIPTTDGMLTSAAKGPFTSRYDSSVTQICMYSNGEHSKSPMLNKDSGYSLSEETLKTSTSSGAASKGPISPPVGGNGNKNNNYGKQESEVELGLESLKTSKAQALDKAYKEQLEERESGENKCVWVFFKLLTWTTLICIASLLLVCSRYSVVGLSQAMLTTANISILLDLSNRSHSQLAVMDIGVNGSKCQAHNLHSLVSKPERLVSYIYIDRTSRYLDCTVILMWTMLLLVPQVAGLLKGLYAFIRWDSVRGAKLAWMSIVLIFVTAVIETTGLCLLILEALPYMDPEWGLLIPTLTMVLPSFYRLIKATPGFNPCKRIAGWIFMIMPNILTVGLFMFIISEKVIRGYEEPALYWTLPTSILVISFAWMPCLLQKQVQGSYTATHVENLNLHAGNIGCDSGNGTAGNGTTGNGNTGNGNARNNMGNGADDLTRNGGNVTTGNETIGTGDKNDSLLELKAFGLWQKHKLIGSVFKLILAPVMVFTIIVAFDGLHTWRKVQDTIFATWPYSFLRHPAILHFVLNIISTLFGPTAVWVVFSAAIEIKVTLKQNVQRPVSGSFFVFLLTLVLTVVIACTGFSSCFGSAPLKQCCPLVIDSDKLVLIVSLAVTGFLGNLPVIYNIMIANHAVLIQKYKVFTLATSNAVLMEPWLWVNITSSSLHQRAKITDFRALRNRSKIYICTTMYREDEREMQELLRSIKRINDSRGPAKPLYEAHLFFDGAVCVNEKGRVSFNAFALQLIALVELIFGTKLDEFGQKSTPYGIQWAVRLHCDTATENKPMVFYIHLKDNAKVKKKKRWSQIMYMVWAIEHEAEVPVEDRYVLITDGDTKFYPKGPVALLDSLLISPEAAAVVGRVRPMITSSPLVWYQVFEYAASFWIYKASNDQLGTDLCCSGCFTMYRGSMLRDVIKDYAIEANNARDFLMIDMGEDLWLSTLLIRSGYKLKYCSVADVYTRAPSELGEYYKQRRRWYLSSLAYFFFFIRQLSRFKFGNRHVTLPYLFYQGLLLCFPLISTSTHAMILAVGQSYALMIPLVWSVVGVAVIFIAQHLVCLFAPGHVQIKASAILSILPSISTVIIVVVVMMNVCTDYIDAFTPINGTTLAESRMTNMEVPVPLPTLMLSVLVVLVFATGLLHPKEFYYIFYVVFFIVGNTVGYTFLRPYMLCNVTDQSWGTRESKSSEDNATDTTLQRLRTFFDRLCEPRVRKTADEAPHTSKAQTPSATSVEANQGIPCDRLSSLSTNLSTVDSAVGASISQSQSSLTIEEKREDRLDDEIADMDLSEDVKNRMFSLKDELDERTQSYKTASDREDRFWERLIELKLSNAETPANKTANQHVQAGLRKFQRDMLIVYFTLNALWITIIVLFWFFFGGKITTTGWGRHFDIVMLIAIPYVLINLVQFVAMFVHRLAIWFYLLARTRCRVGRFITCGYPTPQILFHEGLYKRILLMVYIALVGRVTLWRVGYLRVDVATLPHPPRKAQHMEGYHMREDGPSGHEPSLTLSKSKLHQISRLKPAASDSNLQLRRGPYAYDTYYTGNGLHGNRWSDFALAKTGSSPTLYYTTSSSRDSSPTMISSRFRESWWLSGNRMASNRRLMRDDAARGMAELSSSSHSSLTDAGGNSSQTRYYTNYTHNYISPLASSDLELYNYSTSKKKGNSATPPDSESPCPLRLPRYTPVTGRRRYEGVTDGASRGSASPSPHMLRSTHMQKKAHLGSSDDLATYLHKLALRRVVMQGEIDS